MNIRDFLRLVGAPTRTNYFVLCADEMGLNLLLQGALAPIAPAEDTYFYDAEGVTKEKARQIEDESRYAPRGGGNLSHFYIYSLQKLPTDSVGPLLKAVEEARYSRFIFQAQAAPPKIHTLMSRSSVVRLPFLPKNLVLGNMKAMNYDARTADQLGLWDGTLGGTIKALSMKDSMLEYRRETANGTRGLAALYHPDVMKSLAFRPATNHLYSDEERRFMTRAGNDEDSALSTARRKIALFTAMTRVEQ